MDVVRAWREPFNPSGVVEDRGLPSHFVPHSLRHMFCSLLVSAGVSPVYVQQQAGHANVSMTVGVYGYQSSPRPGARGFKGRTVRRTQAAAVS